jgi:hypothetical protein
LDRLKVPLYNSSRATGVDHRPTDDRGRLSREEFSHAELEFLDRYPCLVPTRFGVCCGTKLGGISGALIRTSHHEQKRTKHVDESIYQNLSHQNRPPNRGGRWPANILSPVGKKKLSSSIAASRFSEFVL